MKCSTWEEPYELGRGTSLQNTVFRMPWEMLPSNDRMDINQQHSHQYVNAIHKPVWWCFGVPHAKKLTVFLTVKLGAARVVPWNQILKKF